MVLLIIFLSLLLSLNLNAQFRSTSIYLDNTQPNTEFKYVSADEYLESVTTSYSRTRTYSPTIYKAPGKPNDPFPTPVDDRVVPVALILFGLGFGVYKFVKECEK